MRPGFRAKLSAALLLAVALAAAASTWIAVQVYGAFSEDITNVFFHGSVVDISERKQAEAALRESETRYRSLFNNMVEGFAYCRMLFEDGQPQDFIYLDVNEAFQTLTGLKNVVGRGSRGGPSHEVGRPPPRPSVLAAGVDAGPAPVR